MYVPPITVRQRKQADRAGESQHEVEHLSAARCVLKPNEEIEICPNEKCMQPQADGDAGRTCLYIVCLEGEN